MTRPLEIAVGHADITPSMPRRLVGYIARTAAGQPTGDSDLQVNVTALREAKQSDPTVIIITVDTLFLDETFLQVLAARLKRPDLENRLLGIASHTHGAPNLQDRDFMECPRDPNYRCQVLDALVKLINPMLVTDSAWQQVVQITSRIAPCAGLVCRRRIGPWIDLRRKRLRWGCHFGQNPSGITDPFIRGLEFHGPSGAVSVWWSFPAHPAFFPFPTQIHADFPSVVRKSIRMRTPQATVLFFPGLAGSVIPAVNPAPHTGIWWRDLVFRLPLIPSLGHFSPKEFETWAESIAARWQNAASYDLSFEQGVHFAQTHIASLFRDTDPAFRANLALLDIGTFRLLCLSGEPVARWRSHLMQLATEHTLMTGYLAGQAGYLATPDILEEGGYEVDEFQSVFGIRGRLAPNADKRVISAFEALLNMGN